MAERDLACAPENTAPLGGPAEFDELDDGDLLELTRRGSTEAYAVLYDRYVYGARRLARHLGQREESDDVVSDAFAQIFSLLQRGKGPDRAFRAYLFTSIRHESGRRAKAGKRVMPTDDDTVIDTAVPFGEGNLDDFEKQAVRAAYESLPDRWRTVLWHLDVEGRKPHELVEVMGLKANSVSALVYRARAGLREAYLQQHVSTTDESAGRACLHVRDSLATVVRRTATKRDQEKVHAHLETCDECMAVYLDLKEVNREVGAIAMPTALVAVAGGGAVAAAAASGGAVVANVVAAAKGLLVAAAAPTAAAAVAGVAVISVATPSDDPAVAAQTSATARPVVAAVEASPDAPTSDRTPSARQAPRVGAADGITTRKPATAAGSSSASEAPRESDAPSTSASAGPGVGQDVGVDIAPGEVKVSAGAVKLSTKPVTDLVESAVPKTTETLKQILGVPAK